VPVLIAVQDLLAQGLLLLHLAVAAAQIALVANDDDRHRASHRVVRVKLQSCKDAVNDRVSRVKR